MDYSPLDRAIHRLAFRTVGLQKILAESEDDLFSRQLKDIEIRKPVFICSLPRAGTTLLLNFLNQLPLFTTHTYRNMPFVLCPLMWNSLTRSFRKEAVLKERAHGDAVEVGFDSPEAFEEIIWKAFWQEKYQAPAIKEWRDNESSERFDEFFKNHILKIISLEEGAAPPGARYISKNNANIARIAQLERLFPDCRIVIPFRNPADHVTSLNRQHRNFLDRHQTDPFAQEYMAAIGHYDFGANLKPIDFDGWYSAGGALDPLREEFWLKYWNATFSHLTSQNWRNVVWLDYDALVHQPMEGLERLFAELDIVDASQVPHFAQQLRAPTSRPGSGSDFSVALLERAKEIHQDLLTRC